MKNLSSKGENDASNNLPKEEQIVFILKANGMPIGRLVCKDGAWEFHYTIEFKAHQNDYNVIVGFPDVNKSYHSEVLWPFFRIRIPGLKQPMVQDIIRREHLDINNEALLLKRFGRKTISNPYELEPA